MRSTQRAAARRRKVSTLTFPADRIAEFGACALQFGVSVFLEDVPGDRDCGNCIGPTGIEGHLRDDLGQLLFGHAVLERQGEMRAKLVWAIRRDQRSNRDEAAIPFRKLRTLPDISKQDLVGELCQL